MKTKSVIGFKADDDTLKKFNEIIDNLGVEKSELAELAHKRGLARAAEEIMERQMQKAQHRVAKLSAFSLQALLVLNGKNAACVPHFV